MTFVVLDLVGIFVFAISGAVVAVRKGLDVFGVLVLAGRVPVIFRGELYATPALAGAAVVVVGDRLDVPVVAVTILGAGVCLVWRLLAMWRDWSAPMATGPASV